MRTRGFLPGLLILIVVAAAADWLSVRTTRLYLDKASAGNAREGTVKQEFKVHGKRVRPEIAGESEARFRFEVNTTTPCELMFSVDPKGPGSYEIVTENQGTRRQIAANRVEHRTKCVISLPAHVSYLEFKQHGAMRWLDLRLVRSFFLWPAYALGFGLVLTITLLRPSRLRFFRHDWVGYIASGLLCLAAVEVGLRLLSKRLPPAMIAARRDSGAVGEDTRAFDPIRYELRLRPNLNTYCEWRYGNITRDGIIPKEITSGLVRRYPFRTDAEGFRNEKVREAFDVAALGDSFTDGALGPMEESWPSRLEQLSGLTVQNYGVSGFGPQQELYALQDFVLKHHPRWVVVAFYAGNDLHDAEIFDRWEKQRYKENEELEGWELVRSYRRFETFYLWTLGKVSAGPLLHLVAPSKSMVVEKTTSDRPCFDRGMFSIPVADRTLQFAFLWQYLRQLGVSRAEIEISEGWRLAERALRTMNLECKKNGTSLLLVFVPEKTQVYWPLLERAFPTAELQKAFDFYCPPGDSTVTIEAIQAHCRALNNLFADFCTREQIPMLDLSEPLELEVQAGHGMYYADDIHWNAAGQEAAARAIAKRLETKPSTDTIH